MSTSSTSTSARTTTGTTRESGRGSRGSVSIDEIVRQLPTVLQEHDAEDQVGIVLSVLRQLQVQVGTYSLKAAQTAFRILKTACHHHHRSLPRQAIALLKTFLSCSERELVSAVLDYLPFLVNANNTGNVSDIFGNGKGIKKTASAEMKMVSKCLNDVIKVDRSFVVPVIHCLYELDLDEELSSTAFDMALGALEVVDSTDVPAVIRTLLKSALHGGRHTSNTLHRVIAEIRRCSASLNTKEQVRFF